MHRTKRHHEYASLSKQSFQNWSIVWNNIKYSQYVPVNMCSMTNIQQFQDVLMFSGMEFYDRLPSLSLLVNAWHVVRYHIGKHALF